MGQNVFRVFEIVLKMTCGLYIFFANWLETLLDFYDENLVVFHIIFIIEIQQSFVLGVSQHITWSLPNFCNENLKAFHFIFYSKNRIEFVK